MRQKEIWLVNLDPTIGAEITKTRPCVILNDDSMGILPLKIIAPITDFKAKYQMIPWMVPLKPNDLNHLKKKSVIDLFQIRSISQQRLVKKSGEISNTDLTAALEAVKIVLGME